MTRQFSWCCVWLLMSLGSAGSAEVERDDTTNTEIEVPTSLTSTDDYLIAMAKAADANVFADSTDFWKEAPPLEGVWTGPPSWSSQGRWKGQLGNMLRILAHEHWLSWSNQGNRTLLFWADNGNFRDLGSEIAKGGSITSQHALTQEGVQSAVEDYLKQQHGWNGQAADLKLEVPFTRLPELTRQLLQSAYQRHIVEEHDYRSNLALFQDEFWESARLTSMEVVTPAMPSNTQAPKNGNLQFERVYFLLLEGQITDSNGKTITVKHQLGRVARPYTRR